MLSNENKTSALWKHYKGWGSTHPERETFEEFYRAYNNISTNSVLTYGNLIPRKESDELFYQVKALDATNNTVYFQESSFKTVPIIKKHISLTLTRISPNCNHAFAILDENGNQIRNIIPYDYSDTGLYQITLKTQDNEEIVWGSCDWVVDTNAAILTFNNGVPSGVSASRPPILTFYQYIGPVGERHYIDAALFDIENVKFASYDPVADFTQATKDFLEDIEEGFFDNYKFNGTDLTQGIGLQYNILSNIIETATNDPVKGYDDNSEAQVVSLMSHKDGRVENLEVKFISEGIPNGRHQIIIEPTGEDYVKINTEDGFFVLEGRPGTYDITVYDSERIKAVVLVKNNKTLDYDLFFPRGELRATLKLPVFIDLMKLPPHIKLTTLNSYSDHITPQYYGPRVADFVIATDETTVQSRSADFVIYNRQGFYIQDAIAASKGTHLFFRNGEYENAKELVIDSKYTITGETKQSTIIKDVILNFEESCFVENFTFKNCQITVKKDCTFKNCSFEKNTTLFINGESSNSLIENCDIEKLEINAAEGDTELKLQVFNSRILNVESSGVASFFNTSIVESFENSGAKVELYSSYVKDFVNTNGLFYINASRIEKLDAEVAAEGSIVNTTNIGLVESLPETVKLDSSYVVKFSEKIDTKVYPDSATIPYYSAFNRRVYAKLPVPFSYSEETNEISLLLDSINHTIFVNKNGELQCRFFTSREISIEYPETYETQIESVYGLHADTKLETDKPTSVDEALLDLYWSKADLRNGKVPIDQLPDSVAYGGLSFVGMWSFEDSEGQYPTFQNVTDEVLAGMSDDDYSGLQPGWFFIVSASHKEDDPVYPQNAIDGEVYTAGDWVIYKGTTKASSEIDFSKPAFFKIGDKYIVHTSKGACQVFDTVEEARELVDKIPALKDAKEELDAIEEQEKENQEDLPEDEDSKVEDSEDTTEDTSDETQEEEAPEAKIITVNVETGEITALQGEIDIEDLEVGKNISEFYPKVISGKYEIIPGHALFEKLDRAYQDPVYSRLPELATKTGDENPEWSILDGGTGLLRLSYVSLAEAIRLINEVLFRQTADRPVSIQEIGVELDEENTTATKREYIVVSHGLQLNQIVKNKPDICWDATKKDARVYFKQKGKSEHIPLEQVFYCGKSSTINVFDKDENITENATIERFDPYKKYRLGFRTPTFIDAATVSGYVTLGKGGHKVEHSVRYTQYDLERSPLIHDPVEELEGETSTFEFSERKFYTAFDECEIRKCGKDTVNLRVLNNLLESNRTGAYGFIPNSTPVTGTFLIKHFTKFDTVSPDANVSVRATFNDDVELECEITSQTLQVVEVSEGVFDLQVTFKAVLPDADWLKGDLSVKAIASNFGKETEEFEVLVLKNLILIKPETIPTIVESASTLWPTLGKNYENNEFGSSYSIKKASMAASNHEVVFTKYGYGWPTEVEYVETIDTFDESTSLSTDWDGLDYNNKPYRFVTFKHKLDAIQDLCGFKVKIDWSNNKPSINPKDGTYTNALLQVCVNSAERPNVELLDANKAVPVFFEAKLEQAEPCNYAGKSTVDVRRITFGRNPVPVQDIYVRIGIEKDSDVYVRGTEILLD